MTAFTALCVDNESCSLVLFALFVSVVGACSALFCVFVVCKQNKKEVFLIFCVAVCCCRVLGAARSFVKSKYILRFSFCLSVFLSFFLSFFLLCVDCSVVSAL